MKEIVYICMDLLEYTFLGNLLAYLLYGRIQERFFGTGSGKMTSCLLCIQFVIVRLVMSRAVWVKQLIYGKEMFLVSSRQSIIPAAVSMAVTLLMGMLLYKGSRMKLLSLVTAFYALLELVRFTYYPLAVKSMNIAVDYYNRLCWERGKMTIEHYQRIMGRIEIVWNGILFLVLSSLMLFCVKKYKGYLPGAEEVYLGKNGGTFYRPKEAALLFVPALLGLVYAVMLRSILFYHEREVFSIIEEYPELNIMIPVLSLLCIILILLSVKILGELEEEHEKRRQAELYQNKVKDLEAHVRDMESVSIQIRGMKHDMKNYIADINALLAQMALGDESAKEEVRHYIHSIQASLEELDVVYQTKNPVTDVILGRYVRLARQRGIAFSSDFIYPERLGMDVFDLSVILNNGLENAFEACEKEEGDTFVSLGARQKGNMFLLTMENSFSGTLQWEGEFPASVKSGGSHGLGLKNIKSCVEKYYGTISLNTNENKFCLMVMLQGKDGFDDKI